MTEHPKFGVIIGPLRVHQNPDHMAKNIFRLLNCVGIRCMDTAKISVNPEAGYSIVEFYQKSVQDYAIKVLKEVQSLMNLYDLRLLTDKPQYMKAEKLGQQTDGINQDLSSLSVVVLAQYKTSAQKDYTLIEDDRSSMLKHASLQPQITVTTDNIMEHKDDQLFQLVSLSALSGDSDTQISFQRLEEDNDDDERVVDSAQTLTSVSCYSPAQGSATTNDRNGGGGSSYKLDAKTSTPQISPCFYSGSSFYLRYQKLTTSVRNVYFNNGDIIFRSARAFRIMIGQHVCAYLNSGGGAIYFGVTKEKKVRGIQIDNRLEDSIRLSIDDQIKLLKPLVPITAYKVNFVNVMDDTGHLVPDLRVLEVEVHPRDPPAVFYRFKSSVFVMEQGEVKELDQADIFF